MLKDIFEAFDDRLKFTD